MALLLWLLAVVLIVFGVVKLVQRDFIMGVILLIVGIVLASFTGFTPV
jgi:hypothetical protein